MLTPTDILQVIQLAENIHCSVTVQARTSLGKREHKIDFDEYHIDDEYLYCSKRYAIKIKYITSLVIK